MDKEQLEQAIVMLEELCEQDVIDSAGNLDELAQAKKDLADINKPELTPLQFDNLYEAVESGVSGYDFSDQDNFDTEFELDYDNKVTLSSLDISNSQDLVEAIVEELTKLFTEKLDTTEADNHPVDDGDCLYNGEPH